MLVSMTPMEINKVCKQITKGCCSAKQLLVMFMDEFDTILSFQGVCLSAVYLGFKLHIDLSRNEQIGFFTADQFDSFQ